jgi:allophanate hydrolase subunit 2
MAQLARATLGLSESEPVFELLRGTGEFTFEGSGTVSCIGLQGNGWMDDVAFPIGTRMPVRPGATLRIQSNLAYLGFTKANLPKSRVDQLPVSSGVIRYLPTGDTIGIGGLVVDAASSRAGVRFNGLSQAELREIPSEPTCIGAIQRTPSGQLIVIGPDGPTIGGYPRVGTVIEADLDLVARLLTGQEVNLEPVDWETAIKASDRRDVDLASRLALIRPGL